MQSYDYSRRRGIRTISWDDFATLGARLAEQLDQAGVDVVIGIARAGLFPATLVACSLRKELIPVRLTRRLNDQVVYQDPVWRVPLAADLSGKSVAVVDEIADSGQTLCLVAEEARLKGAREVKTACLVSHTWAEPTPDFTVVVSDELIIFPWDRQVLVEGQWQTHPEIQAATQAQESGNRPIPAKNGASEV